MKLEIIPYIVDDLHSTIDYMKLIEMQANAFSGYQQGIQQEKGKQKVYCNPTLNQQNQRYNRNRESSGINPRNK